MMVGRVLVVVKMAGENPVVDDRQTARGVDLIRV